MEKVKDWNYKVVEKIGQGVFGEVYKCLNRETGQKVAIKMIAIQNEAEGAPSSLISRLSRLKELEHDNIVRLLDVLNGDRYLYLVFEYLDLDLGSLIRKHTITSIRPLINVLTLYYRAPEFLLGRTNYSPAIDMWAVGCIFAEMVKGKRLFGGLVKYVAWNFQFTQCSYFGMPGADTLPDVTLISDHYWRKPIDKLNLAEELTRLEPDGLDLLFRMLSLNPTTRLTAESARNHPYFKGKGTRTSPLSSPEQ